LRFHASYKATIYISYSTEVAYIASLASYDLPIYLLIPTNEMGNQPQSQPFFVTGNKHTMVYEKRKIA
jgi:hypothetical protein